MKKYTSENEGRHIWRYVLELMAGSLVLWLLGYVVFAFYMI